MVNLQPIPDDKEQTNFLTILLFNTPNDNDPWRKIAKPQEGWKLARDFYIREKTKFTKTGKRARSDTYLDKLQDEGLITSTIISTHTSNLRTKLDNLLEIKEFSLKDKSKQLRTIKAFRLKPNKEVLISLLVDFIKKGKLGVLINSDYYLNNKHTLSILSEYGSYFHMPLVYAPTKESVTIIERLIVGLQDLFLAFLLNKSEFETKLARMKEPFKNSHEFSYYVESLGAMNLYSIDSKYKPQFEMCLSKLRAKIYSDIYIKEKTNQKQGGI